MTKFWRVFCYLSLTTFLLGCTQNFCTLHCDANLYSAPAINQHTIDSFAEEHVQLIVHGDTLRIILPVHAFFKTNTATLKENSKPALKKVMGLLSKYGTSATVRINGYGDPILEKSANQKITLARADAVLVYFWSQGLDPAHLYAYGYGGQNLVADPNYVNSNIANSRVEITVRAHCTTCL